MSVMRTGAAAFAAGALVLGLLGARSADPVPGVSGPLGRQTDNIVEVRAVGLRFEAPSRVPAGWVTFRFRNDSPMAHFAIVERMPPGKGLKEQQQEIAPIFQRGMDLLNAGKPEAAGEAFKELPPWFGDIVFLGGPGLLSAGRTADATVRLEPGTYLLECYVKTNGIFHSYNPAPGVYGMVHEFQVTGDATAGRAPTPDVTLTLSSERGIAVQGELKPGRRSVAVQFADQKVYSHFLGHDVHLAELAEGTDLAKLATWMDWRHRTGLETPAPAVFVGGTHEMPAGSTAHFTVDVRPGRYAWIAEVPDPAPKGMLRVFTVS